MNRPAALLTALAMPLVIFACSESASPAAYNPPPKEENPLLSETVSAAQLRADLAALGALATKGPPDDCVGYWKLASFSEAQIGLEERPRIAAHAEQCAAYAKTLAEKLRAKGYTDVQANDLHDIDVWAKAILGG